MFTVSLNPKSEAAGNRGTVSLGYMVQWLGIKDVYFGNCDGLTYFRISALAIPLSPIFPIISEGKKLWEGWGGEEGRSGAQCSGVTSEAAQAGCNIFTTAIKAIWSPTRKAGIQGGLCPLN